MTVINTMLVALAACALVADLLKPPKQPTFDLYDMCRVSELSGANEMKLRQESYRDMSRWTRLYGIDLPAVGKPGYSGARQDLEVILGRSPDVYVEDEKPDHPVTRNATWVQYVWTRGKLIQFEVLQDGWATVNEEGRKGRYGKYLVGAETEAKRLHEGIWEKAN